MNKYIYLNNQEKLMFYYIDDIDVVIWQYLIDNLFFNSTLDLKIDIRRIIKN